MLMAGVCASLLVAGCGGSSSAASEATTSAAAEARPKPKVLPQGPKSHKLIVKDLIKGTGAEAKNGDVALVHYVAGIYERGEEIESGWVKGSAFEVPLGSHRAKLPYWEKGLVGMRVGGRRALIFPTTPKHAPLGSELGETLVYVIDLLAIKK